ncbi:CoA transferase [Streptomyces sp. NPDC001165]|uniref:CoA transferase n=1 Tax=Streptomyces sp. NPDC001165 TaxID=3364546 RepID=UPI0036CAACA8
MKPLQGIRVLELGGWLAGALAGRLLSDLGADVIRVVPAGSAKLPEPLNRALAAGKEEVSLDLRQPRDRAEAEVLIAGCDVVLENARPGALERAGLNAADCRARDDRLIWVSQPGFASTDTELSNLPAWEVVLGAACGLYTDTSLIRGLVGLPPVFTALPLASVYGGVHGALAAVAALVGRERDGCGDHVEVPLAASLLAAMGPVLLHPERQPSRYDTPPLPALVKPLVRAARAVLAHAPLRLRERVGALANGLVPPLMDSYTCADGRLLYVFAMDHDRLPTMLLDKVGVLVGLRSTGLGTHNLYGPSRRDNLLDGSALAPAARRKVRKALADAFATRPAHDWERLLGDAGLPCAVQRTSAEWAALPETALAGLFTDRNGIRAPGPAVWYDAEPEAKGVPFLVPPPKSLPLQGCRVIDLSCMVAGPIAARTLAELGADVIKIDAPRPHHGPRMVCWYGLEVNRGKRSVLLDIARPEGAETLRRALSHTDVVVENFSGHTLARLGLDPRELRAAAPHVAWTTISAFEGPSAGPWAERRGYDPVLQAATGIMLRYGGSAPELHAIASCVDALTGYLAALATVSGLLVRARGGTPPPARTSLAAAAGLAQLPFMLLTNGHAAFEEEPSGPNAVGVGALQRLYRARDGHLALGARDDQLTDVLHALAIAPCSESSDLTCEGAVAEKIAAALRRRTVRDAVAALRAAGAGAIPVRSLDEIREQEASYDSTRTLGLLREPNHPAGTSVTAVAPTYLRFSRRGPLRSGAPAAKPGSDTFTTLSDWAESDAVRRMVQDEVAADHITSEYLPS